MLNIDEQKLLTLFQQRLIMAIVDLINCTPVALAESTPLPDLMESIREIDRLNDRQAEVLDYIYKHRLVRLIRTVKKGEGAAAELTELYEHLNRVAHPRRLSQLNTLEKPYGARWIAYQDILEHRLAVLVNQPSKWLLNRAHVKGILRLVVKHGSISRKKIPDHIKIKQANLTRVLNMMAANELIECHTVGKEKILTIGENGAKFRSEIKSDDPSDERGSTYLRLAS